MEHVQLGQSGLRVSPISFGTWQLSPRFWGEQSSEEIARAIRRAFDGGVNLFDTADAYGDGLRRRCWARRSPTCRATT